ncbi:uncharacterized protein LOC116845429 [Odontomachus brunneus]|uniref:uncharacterized protein LOC116845429 n=1 Tax=Odontomachus brunneus TaxID=486640 RepID=UPI0013F195D3|nr:uncharacterized protein LOC116845429 [Odontomachus brunneus]
MFFVIFHIVYLLGKYVYDNYQDRRTNKSSSNDGTEDETAGSRHPPDDYEVDIEDEYEKLPLQKFLNPVKFSPPAYIQRYLAVKSVLEEPKYANKVRKIVDFGCANLNFLPYMKYLEGVEEILFVDVDRDILEQHKFKAAPLLTDHFGRQTRFKIGIYEGSVTHNDKKLEKTDAVVCIELIEHLHTPELSDLPTNIFAYIKPKVVIITTPNVEFNVVFPNLRGFRHPDHKFEWTRKQFEDWAKDIVRKYSYYSVRFQGVCYGPEDTKHLGACSQMAIFELNREPNASIEIAGVEELFQTIKIYDYPVHTDDRSDTQKVLDEVSYCINKIVFELKEESNEIDLARLQNMIYKYSISIEILRDIMSENNYVIEDRESGPVVILPEYSETDEMDMMDMMEEMEEIYTLEDTFIDDYLSEDEEQLMEVYDTSSDAVYEKDDWNEESIVIAKNQIVPNHENSYLFDGEHLADHHRSSEEWGADAHTVDAHTTVVHTADITDVSTMTNNGERFICEKEVLRSERDPCASNTTETNNVIEIDDDITFDTTNSLQAVSQDVGINLGSIPNNDDTISSFQPYLSISRSSTSPGLLFSPDLDDSLISQNLLNSTFQRSEVSNEAITIVKLPTETSSMNEALSLKEKDLSEHTSLSYLERNSSNIELNNVDSVKHRVLENTSNDKMIKMEVQHDFSGVYHKPQSTSSPRICNKLRTTCTINMENQIVSTQEYLYDEEHSTEFARHNILHRSSEELAAVSDIDFEFPKCNNRKEPIITVKQSCLEGDDLISALESYTELIPIEAISAVIPNTATLKDTSQKSLCSDSIITETINHEVTSNSKNATSKRETDANCSSSNNSQPELCLKSEIVDSDHSTAVGLLRESKETTGKGNLIKYETDIAEVQRYTLDKHCVLSSAKGYVCRKSKAAVIKLCDDDTETHLQDGNRVVAHSSISDKSLSPFRELSNIKSGNTSECSSSMCAKENNSDESFQSCDEDANNKVVQFESLLRSDENVVCDIKNSTNKDVNTSSVAGFIASAEAKLPSPTFETPPDSWSHEIVDSGYPNSASGQDITPENDLSSIAQDHIPDTESPSVAEAPRLGVLEPIEVENGDLANNNRDNEGNNMMAADAGNDIEGLQPLIDVLENDLENENDIYALENGFPVWLLRILDMANPLDFDGQNLRVHHEVADVDYMDHDEGFDSSSSDE